MWYIFDRAGACICTADHEPNHEDLAERGEKAVESEAVYPVHAVYLKNGAVKEKALLPSEQPKAEPWEEETPPIDEMRVAFAEALAAQEARIAALEAAKGGEEK